MTAPPISDEARKNFARWGEDQVRQMPYWVLEARDGYEAALTAALARAERAEKALETANEISEVYFAPWGAWKSAKWEDLCGDQSFTAETALKHIQKLASRARNIVEG